MDKPYLDSPSTIIRFWRKEDISQVLVLMEKLALFEGYLDEFSITPQYLLTHGFNHNPMFKILVAQLDNEIVGYAAYFTVPFTFKAQPKIVLKELYFSPKARGKGFSVLLFDALKKDAKLLNACAIEWLVLQDNMSAKAFYLKQGAQHDTKWQSWSLLI